MAEPKRSLKIDLDELTFAFDNGSPEAEYYLDLETGALLLVMAEGRWHLDSLLSEVSLGEGASAEEVLAALQELDDWEDTLHDAVLVELDAEGTRYLPIPHQSSREGYEDMEAFIETVTDEHLAELLAVAIDGRGAFRRFKGVLARYPQERERWFRFKDERLRQRALDWLARHGIEPEDS